jgi:signal transduction histidine kinase
VRAHVALEDLHELGCDVPGLAAFPREDRRLETKLVAAIWTADVEGGEDGGAEVEVEDSGAGIAPEHLEQIFDLYFTTKAEGAGLGLSLVHRIITQHGGGVQVHSTPDTGSRFTLHFPASD